MSRLTSNLGRIVITSNARGRLPAIQSAKPGTKVKRVSIVDRPRVVKLDLEFKSLDQRHRYLGDHGLTDAVVDHFSLGYCTRGPMKGRIVIPLHDKDGKLNAYAAYLGAELAINDSPKYPFPNKRDRGGIIKVFKKSGFLYNGHRVNGPVDDLIVVDGFTSVWWLWRQGYQNVVAVLGASCSIEEASLIVAAVLPHGRVWLFLDGDAAGTRCAISVLRQVALHRLVRWVKLGADPQPTKYGVDELGTLLQRKNQQEGSLFNHDSKPDVVDDGFLESIERASETVSKWPEWKQNALGGSRPS